MLKIALSSYWYGQRFRANCLHPYSLSSFSFLKDHFVKAGSSRAPQCNGQIYDGTFSQTLIDGDGVTTTLLKRNGIKVVNEEDF